MEKQLASEKYICKQYLNVDLPDIKLDDDKRNHFIPCNVLHYGNCYVRHLQIFCVVFFKSLKFYWPVHFIPLLISPSLIYNRNSQKHDYWYNTFLAGGLGGLSVFAESPDRREEVDIYCFPRILEIIYGGLKKRGYVKTPNNAEVLLFSLTMGFIMYYMEKKPRIFSPIHRYVVKMVFGIN